MNKLLIAALIACCASSAWAQTAAPATTDSKGTDKKDTVSAQDKRPVNSFCPTSGSLVRRDADIHATRAVDCATSTPGHTYTREDLDHTGGLTTAQALRQLDPALH